MKNLGTLITNNVEYNVLKAESLDSLDYVFSDDENTIILVDSIVSYDGTEDLSVEGALGIMHTAYHAETYNFTMYDCVNLEGLHEYFNNHGDFGESGWFLVDEGEDE